MDIERQRIVESTDTGTDTLKAPFPYFGGKSAIADLVWKRFGDVDNYVEPFCGSCAMLLCRPADHVGSVETISDRNHFVANFWRAVKGDPQAVAKFADWPVNEIDCHARHAWLMRSDQSAEIKSKVESDPDYFDARTAGWWCWGQSLWIGSGWCVGNIKRQRPHIGDAAGAGVHRKLPSIGDASGKGVHRKRPSISKAFGNGVHRKLPSIGDASGKGVCDLRRAWITEWMQSLSDRLRNVRVCCDEWSRVCSSRSTTTRLGTTGIFLDPPYVSHYDDGSASRSDGLYAGDDHGELTKLRDDIMAWCHRWGQLDGVRICVAEYEGHGYESLENEGWTVKSWESQGGYGNQSGGKNENASRERLWFSPACVPEKKERMLF